MHDAKNFIWGIVVLFLVSCIVWLNFDLKALEDNLLFSDGARDLLVADHLLSLKEGWLIVPANSSSFLPSTPIYYWLVAILYLFAGMRIQIFFVFYTVWLALCAFFVFLSLTNYVDRFKALLLTTLFAVVFSDGYLSSTLFQPIFSLPIVFFFLWDLTESFQRSPKNIDSIFALILGLFATLVHYSNSVLLGVLLLVLLVAKKRFSEKQLFVAVFSVFGLTLLGLGIFQGEALFKTLQLISWSNDLYFNFRELFFFLIVASFGLLYYATFITSNKSAAQFLLLSSVLFWVVVCIPTVLTFLGIEPRLYYLLSPLLSGVFFFLHGLAVLFEKLEVNLFWERVVLCCIIAVVILRLSVSTTAMKQNDLKSTSAFLIAEYMAQRYFTNQIPFHINVAQFCGDMSYGGWFSGGIWLFFEKITGTKAICLQPTGQNFRECFNRPVSQVYYVCKESNPDFQLPKTVEKVFETKLGWQVFLLP